MSGIDISVLGVPDLQRKLRRLEIATQKKIVRGALRKSAKRVRAYVVTNLSGVKVNVDTGVLLEAYQNAKIKGQTRRGVIRVGIQAPEREDLGIDPDDDNYYPHAIEYGHGSVQAYPFLRPAIDEHDMVERALIGQDIGRGIEKLARQK